MIDLKSWNPWHGCRKYSEGCANCYMFVLDKAHRVPGQFTEIFRTMAFSCAGCGNCGRCKEVELVDLDEIWTPE